MAATKTKVTRKPVPGKANEDSIYLMIPQPWRDIPIRTEEDLKFLGKSNLEFMKQYWRRDERSATYCIKKAQEKLDLFENGGLTKIEQIAAEHIFPDFPKVGVREGGWGIPEPLDADSINREAGTTTFNCCGWCKYQDKITGRHNYAIETCCDLMPIEVRAYQDPFTFDTPCQILNGSEQDVRYCIQFLEKERESYIKRKRLAARRARKLAKMMNDAEDKPVLTEFRNYDHFNLGDRVVCFLDWFDGILPKKVGQFVTGKVVYGYRHQDGCVTICTDEPVHSGENHEGYGLFYGDSRPEVMLEWEYRYLVSHPDYCKIWLHSAEAYARGFGQGRSISVETMEGAFWRESKKLATE